VIEARGLARTFRTRAGEVEAVRGIDLDVQAGEIVGFLGPNGAGKTTTLRMLTTLIAPSAGRARVAGHDLLREPVEVRRRIGYVAQGGCTEPEARVGEELVDHGRLYGMSVAQGRTRGAELLSSLDLEGVWDRQAKTLSGGQRRRLDIAMGLIHAPGLIFLDEPTSGLDPQVRLEIRDLIEELRAEKRTIVMTTHYIEEAERLCDRVAIIDDGLIIASGSPRELQAKSANEAAIEIAFTQPWSGADLPAWPHAVRSTMSEDRRHIKVTSDHPARTLVEMVKWTDAQGIDLDDVRLNRPTLEDVFIELTGKKLRE
jgi:ABC-2 type transport system ATP-binding protein